MQLYLCVLLFAASLRAAPTKVASTLDLASFTGTEAALDQGDGFYVAVFNESGIATVDYTPWNDLDDLTAPAVSERCRHFRKHTSETRRHEPQVILLN